jgi:hypothetical protein
MAVVMETRVKIRTGLLRPPPFDRNSRDLLLFPPHRVRAIHRDRGSIAPLPVALGRVYRVGGRCALEQEFPLALIRYSLQRNLPGDILLTKPTRPIPLHTLLPP